MFKSLLKKSVSIITMVSLFVTAFVSAVPVNAASSHSIYYSAGNVDNILGDSSFIYGMTTGRSFEFSDSERFSRKGYKLSSWHIENTGEDVGCSSTYIMPDYDLYVTANWTPLTYNIGFAGCGGVTDNGELNVYIPAVYGTAMTLPYNPFTKDGYVFKGWSYDGVTYNEGESFEIPAVIAGYKIVLSAVWERKEAVTTAATTVATTTTTTTTTTKATTTTTTTSLVSGQVIKVLNVEESFDANNEIMKKYVYEIIDRDDTIDRLVFHFSANTDSIGTVSIGFFTVLTNGNQYQKNFIETIEGNKFSVNFADESTCNLINYVKNIQIGCWSSEIFPLSLDSIEAVVREPITTTTTTEETTTTTTSATTTTTTEATTTTTTEITTVTTTTTSEATTTTTSTTASQPSEASEVIYINDTLAMGSMKAFNVYDPSNAGREINSMEITFRADNGYIGNCNIGLFMNVTDSVTLNRNDSSYVSNSTYTYVIDFSGENENVLSENSMLNIGYWWGDNSSLTVESIKVNYNGSNGSETVLKGDLNKNGVIDAEDVTILKRLMVGYEYDNIQLSLTECDINNDGSVNVFDSMILQNDIH